MRRRFHRQHSFSGGHSAPLIKTHSKINYDKTKNPIRIISIIQSLTPALYHMDKDRWLRSITIRPHFWIRTRIQQCLAQTFNLAYNKSFVAFNSLQCCGNFLRSASNLHGKINTSYLYYVLIETFFSTLFLWGTYWFYFQISVQRMLISV